MFSAEYVRFECSAEALWEYYMKRFQRLIFVAALALAAISCSSGGDDDHGMSLTEQLNSGTVVDLEGKSFSEDAAVNSAVTIKNGNFGGKTITVNSGNVVLDNVQNLKLVVSDNVTDGTVTIRNSKGPAVTVVVKGGSAITIQDSAVLNVSVEKPNAAVNLSGKTTVSAVDVKADGASIKSDSSAMVTNVSVGEDVRNIAIEGGTVGVVDAGTATVTVGDGVKINDTTGGKFVVSDNTVKLPADAEKLTISRVELVNSSAKTEYEVGDAFDFAELSATVTYSDGSTATVNLTAANTKVNGFNTGKVGSCTVTFEYMGKTVSGSLSVTVKASTKEYKKLLEEGVQLLFGTKYDEGVAKIRAAYEKEQNDETKMYYALAEIATISTDKSVADIMRNNFGVTSYPPTLNALINGDWLKEYKNTEWVWIYEPVKKADGWLVRVNGTETPYYDDSNSRNIILKMDSDGDWIYEYDNSRIKDIRLDDNGKYLINVYDYYNNYSSESIPETVQRWDYDCTDREKLVFVDEDSTRQPEYNLPAWLKESDLYKDSLVKSEQTARTISWLVYGNLIDCNSTGLNGLVDNVLLVFGDKFEKAKKLAAEISESSVTVPADVIAALNLDEVLGDSSIRIGKSELNVLIASMQILKGTFQWLSSYDLSANISSLKKIFAAGETDSLKLIRDVISEKTFAIRNADAMTASKNTFLESIGILDNSYTYLVGPSCEYPQAAKDALKQYGDVLLPAARNLKTCISDGTVFYIPSENPFDSGTWAASATNSSFGIDMGKAFTPGYFSNILKSSGSSSTITFVGSAETSYSLYNENEKVSDRLPEEEIAISDSMSYDDVISKGNEKAVALQKQYSKEGYRGWIDSYVSIGIKLNENVLNGLLPKLSFESVTIPLRSSYSSYEVAPVGKLYIIGDMDKNFTLMTVAGETDSTCTFTYTFTYNSKTMTKWDGGCGKINFKFTSMAGWDGLDYGGLDLKLNSSFVHCKGSHNSNNFTCSGLGEGLEYVITAQKSVTGEVLVKINGEKGTDLIPELDSLTVSEISKPGAYFIISSNSYGIEDITSPIPFVEDKSTGTYIASVDVTIPANETIETIEGNAKFEFYASVCVGGTNGYYYSEKWVSTNETISDNPVQLLVSDYKSFIPTFISSETDKDVNFTITVTADNSGSTIKVTRNE